MRSHKLFPITLVLYEMCVYLSNDAYLPALPQLTHDLATTHHLAQLTLTTWFMGAASMQLIIGPLSDRFGRRPILLMGGILFFTATMLCALSPNIHTLLIARFMQGITVPTVVIAGYAVIHELYDQRQAIHTLALMNSVTVLAPSLGPLFGAAILYFSNWRIIFMVLAVCAAITLVMLYFLMPETIPKEKQHAIHIKSIAHRYKNIITNFDFMARALSMCFLFSAMIAWITAGPFLVINMFHYNVFWFALFQTLIFGTFILTTQSVKLMMNKIALPTLVQSGLIITVIGSIVGLILALLKPDFLVGIVIAMMLLAGGSGFVLPILSRRAIEMSQEPMGARMAIFSSLRSGFGMIGSITISTIYNGTLVSLALVLCGSSLIALMMSQLRRD